MAALTITKVSGVLFITQGSTGTNNPKSYFGATGSYQPSTDNTTILITIGNDQYNVAFGDLTVGTSTATTMSQAKTLLNAIFGT